METLSSGSKRKTSDTPSSEAEDQPINSEPFFISQLPATNTEAEIKFIKDFIATGGASALDPFWSSTRNQTGRESESKSSLDDEAIDDLVFIGEIFATCGTSSEPFTPTISSETQRESEYKASSEGEESHTISMTILQSKSGYKVEKVLPTVQVQDTAAPIPDNFQLALSLEAGLSHQLLQIFPFEGFQIKIIDEQGPTQ